MSASILRNVGCFLIGFGAVTLVLRSPTEAAWELGGAIVCLVAAAYSPRSAK